jgi:arylsulfatase A-like enzyme
MERVMAHQDLPRFTDSLRARRRSFLLRAAALALAAAALSGLRPAAGRRTNVVLFIIDDTRWDSIGAAGNRTVRTPVIDRLARDGVRFSQARVTTSICMVSRASLLTGQYMSRHGITAFGRAIAPDAFSRTYPALLRGAGYWTGYVGKYGVGAARDSDFDFLRAYEGVHWMTGPSGERIHVTEKNARDALDFLKARPRDRPFALTVGFFAAHAEDAAKEQYLPQEWSAALYAGVRIPPPLHGEARYLAALPPFLSSEANEGRIRYHWRFDTPGSYQSYMTRYYRLITEADAAIGRVIEELKAEGVDDDTLIVVIGDNGYFQADRGLADKWYPYEESIRVPLVVRDPRLPASRANVTRTELALNIDVAPTILAAAGLAVPDVMQGKDLSPLYLRGRTPWRDEFFYEHPTITNRDRIPASQAVVRRDWKYVEWPEFDYRQLFDLTSDPDERRNLADRPENARDQSRLRQRLAGWRDRVR